MNSRPNEASIERRWIAAWKRAGPELERMRVEDLRALTEESAARLFDALDVDPGSIWVSDDRIKSLGLVEQQRLFMTSRDHPANRRRRA